MAKSGTNHISNNNSPQRDKKTPLTPEERKHKIIGIVWKTIAGFVAFIILFFILVYNGVIGYMPPVEELKNPTDRFASIIYSADGQEMGRFFRGSGNRVYADYDEISQNVVNALIATEDSRFEQHSGIDFRALSRVIVKTLLMRDKSAGGGSTITQQLAKQLYTPPSDGFWSRAMQKPVEWMIAVKLERYYSKEEIVKMYLNQFDFLYNAVGIKTAAQVYFNKDARHLTVDEAALLVGMVKNPAYYNPVRHPERALVRRNVVFEQMEKAGMLTHEEYEKYAALPLNLDFHRIDHKEGVAPYFREELRRVLTAKKPVRSNYASWDTQTYQADSAAWENNPLFGWIEKNPKADGTYYDLYNDGLRIYTTIDTRMQKYAEEAVNEHMTDLQRRFFREKANSPARPYSANPAEISESTRKKLINNAIHQSERWRIGKLNGLSDDELTRQFDERMEMTVFSYEGPVDTVMTPRDSILYTKSFLRTGFMSMDPTTGHVKAYVGGPDFRFFQYDMVSRGRRQVGSTIKPYLYTLAMEDGYNPCSVFANTAPVIQLPGGGTWTPKSGSSHVGQNVTLLWALTNSNNWISAKLIDEIGASRLVKFMHNMGITGNLPAVPSLCLGPSEISLHEMVGAYSAFANGGMRVEPMYVTAIADNAGNVLATFTPQQTEVIGKTAYYRILNMLMNVVNSGTGHRLRGAPYSLTAEMGGKTGTTNFNADGWFMGFTPDLVSGVWVGGEERYIHFNMTADGQGAEMALPIYGRFMRKVYNDRTLPYSQAKRFEFPSDFVMCEGSVATESQTEEITVDQSIFE